MNIEEFRDYCLSKKGTSEEFPFDENVLAFKVMEKIFALTHLQNFDSISLKCDPEKAVSLREQYPGVVPGYHLNKKHWNTVFTDASIPGSLLRDWIDHSYDRVVDGLPKAAKIELEIL